MSDIRMTLRYCVNVFLVSLAVLLSEMTSRSVKTASKLARIPNQTNVANDKKKNKNKKKTKQKNKTLTGLVQEITPHPIPVMIRPA